MKEETLAIIKPNITRKGFNYVNGVQAFIFNKGFQLKGIKKIKLTREQAEEFYAEHKGKDFFERLIQFMTSGKVIFMILERDDAILKFRAIMKEIRNRWADSFNENAIHGSDSTNSAIREIHFFYDLE